MQHHVTLNAQTAQQPQAIEEWREIPGSEGRYEVSDRGRVRSYHYRKQWHDAPLYLRSQRHPVGYLSNRLQIDGTGRTYLVHRLVMLAFVGPSDLDVNHKDGDKQNNHLDNLEYVTAQQNTRHAMEVLGVRLGVAPGLATATQRDREIRRLAAEGVTQHEIARQFGISQPYVSYIVRLMVRPNDE